MRGNQAGRWLWCQPVSSVSIIALIQCDIFLTEVPLCIGPSSGVTCLIPQPCPLAVVALQQSAELAAAHHVAFPRYGFLGLDGPSVA